MARYRILEPVIYLDDEGVVISIPDPNPAEGVELSESAAAQLGDLVLLVDENPTEEAAVPPEPVVEPETPAVDPPPADTVPPEPVVDPAADAETQLGEATAPPTKQRNRSASS